DGAWGAVRGAGAPLRLVVARVPGWQEVRFDARRRTVCLPRGVELDLGATAKALAADLAAEAALDAAGGGVLVSLGGDIAVRGEPPARGRRLPGGGGARVPNPPAHAARPPSACRPPPSL